MRHARRPAVLATLCLALAPLAARALTAEEREGKRIYFQGTGAAGREIRAFVAGTSVPASAVTCASCHGEDGLGRPEGGVAPPAVVWSELTKRYGHVHPGGRRHPAFDAASVARAIAEGIDPAGNPLDAAMPRFSLSGEDARSLVAYLRVLERDRDPGVSATSLRIVAVLPTRGPLAAAGETMRKVIEASFAEVNAGGGIHGRRLRLAVAGWDPDRGGAAAALRDLLARDPPFALVSGLAPGAEDDLAALAERERLPLVAPFASAPAWARERRYAFWAQPGVREEARALARWAAREPGAARSRTAVVHAGGDALAVAALAAAADLRGAGLDAVETVAFEADGLDLAVAERLRRGGFDLVLFLGGDRDLAALARHADALGYAPRLLVAGTLAGRAAAAAPASFAGRLFVSYPTLPTGGRPGALEALARLRARGGIADRNRAAQMSAATAARLLAEALRRAGRAVTRERLVEALEGLYAFDAGLAPPITFGRGRRVGSPGSYVVAVDVRGRTFQPVSGWIAVE